MQCAADRQALQRGGHRTLVTGLGHVGKRDGAGGERSARPGRVATVANDLFAIELQGDRVGAVAERRRQEREIRRHCVEFAIHLVRTQDRVLPRARESSILADVNDGAGQIRGAAHIDARTGRRSGIGRHLVGGAGFDR
ncbi:hypothetical protein D3C85_1329900 [compost metagenome]